MIDRSLFGLPGIQRVLLLLAGLAVLTAAAILGLAWTLSSALTNLWLGGSLPDQFLWIALFLLCFVGVQGIAYVQDLLLDSYAHERADALRQQLVAAVFTRGPELVQASGTGTTTTLLLEGVSQVEAYLRLILPKLCRILIIPLLLVVPIFLLDWVSGVVVVIVFPFIIFYMVLLGRVAGERAARQHKKYQLLSNHFIDSLRGIDTLKLFGASRQHGKNIYAVSEQFRRATLRTLRIATLSGGVLDLFVTLSVAAVAILLGLRLLDGSLTLFPALTILILAPEYFKPLREFAADFHASLDGRNALTSIQTLIEGARPERAGAAEETDR
ncbi:MAG: thiol reductant ABC exporter subunit CydD, partial [Coriobacteriales bacterium]|nr:thiol reductant ABC exporter subunit CydD [Coriobacteriales bacterium]